jgi:hypothetical protein
MRNLEYLSAALLVSLIFKTPLIKKKRHEAGASGSCRHHAS